MTIWVIDPDTTHWPKPRTSLSASSVLYKIATPKIENSNNAINNNNNNSNNNSGSSRYSKPLPDKPRSQSVDHHNIPIHNNVHYNNPISMKRTLATLNDKTIYAGNNKLITGSGFPTTVRCSITHTRQAHIQLSHIRSTSPNHLTTTPSSSSTSLLLENLIVPLVLLYLDSPIVVQPFSSIPVNQSSFQKMLNGLDDQSFPILQEMVQGACDDAVHCDELDLLQNIIGTVLEKGLKYIDGLATADKFMQTEIHAAFEFYVMEQTYDIVFFKITQVVLQRDLHLSNIIEKISDVDITQLGLPSLTNDIHQRVQRGISILQNIASFRTPSEKLNCIFNTIQTLSSQSSSSIDTADILIPLLLFTIIRSKVPHLIAHWTFMKEFSFTHDVVRGKYGFALSTLEGVLEYISNTAESQLALHSQQNAQLWSYLKALYYYNNSSSNNDNNNNQNTFSSLELKTVYFQCHPPPPISFVIRDQQGNTPLLVACKYGKLMDIPFLAQFESMTTVKNDDGETALMLAVLSGNITLVKYILDTYPWQPDQINAKSKSRYHCRTAVHIASYYHEDPTILKILIEHGALLDITDDLGNTALHLACLRSPYSHSMLHYLLTQLPPSAKHQPNHLHETFYHLCRDQICLIHYSDDMIDTIDSFGRSPWLTWAYHGRLHAMASLLNHPKIDQFRLDSNGQSGLHYIACHLYLLDKLEDDEEEEKEDTSKKAARIQWYIDHLVYPLRDLVHIRDRLYGNTPLHLVATLLTLPLSQSSSSSMKENDHYVRPDQQQCITPSSTPPPSILLPLKVNMIRNRVSVETCRLFIECLLKSGANMNALNDAGQRPIDLCQDDEIISIFETWYLKTITISRFHSDKNDRFYRLWAVTRVKSDPVRFVIKSRKTSDLIHFTTIERSLEDFVFLRQELLNEIPELFLPTLATLYHPNNVDLEPPPRVLLESALTKITQFMDYLQRHPLLRKHDQVQSFVRSQELNKMAIHDKSFSKRNLMIEKLSSYTSAISHHSEDFDESYFLTYIQRMIQPIRDGLYGLVQHGNYVQLYQQGFNDALDKVTQDFNQLTFLGNDTRMGIKLCASLACDKMYVSPFQSLMNTIESRNDISNGVLVSLEHPFLLLKKRAELVKLLEKQRESLQKGQYSSWNGLFSTIEQSKQVTREKENINKTLITLQSTINQINQSHHIISDELAHYQREYPNEMMKTIRSYARRQLKMEKLKLRCLMETWVHVANKKNGQMKS
ncbi:hypothetical protein BJ944DRAFT_268292 [Cunninghamella echinulata]|nr:hypothetical protein BJ944DRAFT_268292 [Cunninghamella echinulata]